MNRTRHAEQVKLANGAIREAYQRRGIEPPTDWEYKPPKGRTRKEELHTWAWKAMKAGNVSAARKHAVGLCKVAPLAFDSWRTLLCALRGY